jgi:hypothetical protein
MLHHYTEFVDVETISESDEICDGVIEEYHQIEGRERGKLASDNLEHPSTPMHDTPHHLLSTAVQKIRFPAF